MPTDEHTGRYAELRERANYLSNRLFERCDRSDSRVVRDLLAALDEKEQRIIELNEAIQEMERQL